ncbi:MAG: 50S ribosomal protein L28 [Candidatus Latescibacteria bacterium]|nr:50S ribosomal protein L28 [Candidatus Latescibacterota bacterium]
MSRTCQVSGKKRLVGNNVSHSHRKTKRAQLPNLIKKRFFIPEENRTVTLKVSARTLRTINKKGLRQVLAKQGINA